MVSGNRPPCHLEGARIEAPRSVLRGSAAIVWENRVAWRFPHFRGIPGVMVALRLTRPRSSGTVKARPQESFVRCSAGTFSAERRIRGS